jgi:aminobenzoyl-glutamate utilization protein B
MSTETNILNYCNSTEEKLTKLARDIWQHPQLALQETYAAKILSGELENTGFSVRRGIADMPTAFIASWGMGKPVIGILAEYDALPGLSQKVSAVKDPVDEGAPGHGCGHNLFGVGCLGAALAVKQEMERNNISGTVRFYGCPAEETLVGKIFMAREGVFDDLDAAITWHPMYANTPWNSSSNALNSFKLNFYGTSAHAGSNPEMGRSALDAVMLTDVGVNYLREHVVQEARIHCVITKGGLAPNIVPDYAQIWYYVRAPRRDQVESIYPRVLDIAKGAALMSGTSYDVEFMTGGYEYIPNGIINSLILEKMKIAGPLIFTSEEKAFANKLKETLAPEIVETAIKDYGLPVEDIGNPLCEKVLDSVGGFEKGEVLKGSTDVGDVSHITPTGQFTTCCKPIGIAGHSWQNTAAAGSSIGFRGMMLAAKVMALAILDLETRPGLLKAAHDDFWQKTGGAQYLSPLPADIKPR